MSTASLSDSSPTNRSVNYPITMGLLPLTYRRPVYVDKDNIALSDESNAGHNTLSNAPTNDSEAGLEKTEQSLKPVNSGSIAGIPSALSFDKIIEGGTCPVST